MQVRVKHSMLKGIGEEVFNDVAGELIGLETHGTYPAPSIRHRFPKLGCVMTVMPSRNSVVRMQCVVYSQHTIGMLWRYLGNFTDLFDMGASHR
jgi:hypothetical protein